MEFFNCHILLPEDIRALYHQVKDLSLRAEISPASTLPKGLLDLHLVLVDLQCCVVHSGYSL